MKTYIKNDLASQSRVWVYQSTRQFTDTEAIVIAEKIQLFVNQWTAHKQGVMGDGALLYNRFVVLMADETHVGVSGCSVDSSVHFVRHLGQEFKTEFVDRWHVA